MRKDIKTNKVVKALALGLAASMAMAQPIEVMAEEAPDLSAASDDKGAVVEASTICDGAQGAVENAQEVVAVVPNSEDVVDDLDSIDGKLEETEMDIVVANGTNAAADKMVDETKKAELEAGAIADEMQAIVDDTDRIADEKIDDIKTATSIADANAANAKLVAAVEAAEEKLANRTEAYNAAVAAYDKAVAEVKALEEAYNAAVANATEDAAIAAKELEEAKKKALLLADEAKLAQAQAQLEDRRISEMQAGSIAEAALALNGVFEAAQAASQQYLDNIKLMSERQQEICEKLEQESREKADALIAETTEKCDEMLAKAKEESQAYWDEVSQRLEAFYNEHHGLRELLASAAGVKQAPEAAKD